MKTKNPHNRLHITNQKITLPIDLSDYKQCSAYVTETIITISLYRDFVSPKYSYIMHINGVSTIMFSNRLKLRSYAIDSFDNDVIRIAIERL